MVTEPNDVLKQLASSDAETQYRAVRCLKNEIIGSPNRKACFIRLGAVPRIVRILAYPQEQRLAVQAAATLGSFAYQNSDGVVVIVESGGVAHLLKALTSSDKKLVEASVRSLKMILQSSISPRDVIFVHPAFDRLVEFLDVSEKSFAEDALIIFAKCCQTKQHQEQLLRSGALPKMIKHLLSSVPTTHFAAMEALDKFSVRQADVCETLLKRDDVIKTLMRSLRCPNVQFQYAACCLLANLSISVVTGGYWFSSEVTEVLVRLLEEASLVAYVPGTLAAIACGRRDLQELIHEQNGFRKLWTFLTEENCSHDPVLYTGIVRAIGTMCQYLGACRREIVTSRTIWKILSFMLSESLELRMATSVCFETIVLQMYETGRTLPVTPFSPDPADRLKQYACVALSVLVSEQAEPDAYVEETFEFLLSFAVGPEPSVRYKGIWALGDVIRTSTQKCKRWLPILNRLVWDFVREMVQDPIDVVREEGLMFLTAMVQSEVGIQAAIDWSNGELLPLIAQKIDGSKVTGEKVTTLALKIVACVANSEVGHQTAVMGSGVPPRLLTCLEEHCAESIKIAAVTCVINLTYRDVLPWGGDDYRSADCRAKALLELGIDESLNSLEKSGGSDALMKLVKDANCFLGQLE